MTRKSLCYYVVSYDLKSGLEVRRRKFYQNRVRAQEILTYNRKIEPELRHELEGVLEEG